MATKRPKKRKANPAGRQWTTNKIDKALEAATLNNASIAIPGATMASEPLAPADSPDTNSATPAAPRQRRKRSSFIFWNEQESNAVLTAYRASGGPTLNKWRPRIVAAMEVLKPERRRPLHDALRKYLRDRFAGNGAPAGTSIPLDLIPERPAPNKKDVKHSDAYYAKRAANSTANALAAITQNANGSAPTTEQARLIIAHELAVAQTAFVRLMEVLIKPPM